jgi:hypothetical protein
MLNHYKTYALLNTIMEWYCLGGVVLETKKLYKIETPYTFNKVWGGIMQLGGNIELAGFNELEPAKLVVVKKLVGNYTKKMRERCESFEQLNVTMKGIRNSQFELHAKLMDNGTPYTAEATDFNVFFALDAVLGGVHKRLTVKKDTEKKVSG